MGPLQLPLKFIFRSTEGQTFYWSIMTVDDSIKCRCANSGMTTQVGGFQNPGVCLQAFPSFLPYPLPDLLLAPFFSRSLSPVPRSFLLNRTETLATQANFYLVSNRVNTVHRPYIFTKKLTQNVKEHYLAVWSDEKNKKRWDSDLAIFCISWKRKSDVFVGGPICNEINPVSDWIQWLRTAWLNRLHCLR